jgi:hypothetical protein
MSNQHSKEQVVTVEIPAEATVPSPSLMSKAKAAVTDISGKNLLKVILLGLNGPGPSWRESGSSSAMGWRGPWGW